MFDLIECYVNVISTWDKDSVIVFSVVMNFKFLDLISPMTCSFFYLIILSTGLKVVHGIETTLNAVTLIPLWNLIYLDIFFSIAALNESICRKNMKLY